jgi:transposase
VEASGTTLREAFGIGPIVACMLIGYSGDPTRFTTASRYAAYTGTAPIEFSSGGRIVHRLSRRGNRRLNGPTVRATNLADTRSIAVHLLARALGGV